MIIFIIYKIKKFKFLDIVLFPSLFHIKNLKKFYILNKKNFKSTYHISLFINKTSNLLLRMFQMNIDIQFPLNNTA
jgi:hypothetical protein